MKFDFFEMTGLSFDPPEKSARKVKTAIDKKIKDLSASLPSLTMQIERSEIIERIDFLKDISRKVLFPDGKSLNRVEYQALASRRVNAEMKRLTSTASLMSDAGSFLITERMIRFHRRKRGLSEEHVREIFTGLGFSIVDIDPLSAMPKFPKNAERTHSEIVALSRTKDPNLNGPDTSLVTDLYAFAAYLEGEPENAAPYRSKTTAELMGLFDSYAKKFSMRNDNLGKLCCSLSIAAKMYVFNSDENRQAYENFLKYKSPSLIALFESMHGAYKADLLDPRLAELCIRKISGVFNDYCTSLSIYNKEAGLVDTPYPRYSLSIRNDDTELIKEPVYETTRIPDRAEPLSGKPSNTVRKHVHAGIAFGNCNAVISFLNERGEPRIIPNYNDGINTFPLSAYFPEEGGVVIGLSAKDRNAVEPDRVIEFVRRWTGADHSIVFEFGKTKYDLISIFSLFFNYIKQCAADQGYDMYDVAVSCPAYFSGYECEKIAQAAEDAGLHIMSFVPEPVAIVLSYYDKYQFDSNMMLVFDLGGGSLDVSLVEKASMKILRCAGDDRFGGVDWDSRMYDYMCDEYGVENGINQDDMEPELQFKIKALVVQAKKDLSILLKKSYTICYDGDFTRVELTREEFESRTQDLVDHAMNIVYRLLAEVEIEPTMVGQVLLAGGGSRIPMIRSALENAFPGKLLIDDPDLAVAKGTALAERYLHDR